MAVKTQPITPKVVHEDTHCLVLIKPVGLLSQGGIRGEKNLVDWLRQHCNRHYVGLIHRLDRNTSGLMVVAKRTKAASRLSASLRQGDLKRSYLGWVEGVIRQEVHWHHRLYKDTQNNISRVDEKRGKIASLVAKPVQHASWQGEEVTLLHFTLETGRSHQIRVQSAHAGHPLLGDKKYGTSRCANFPRLALHSHTLSFPHPMPPHNWLDFTAPLPADLELS